jgi:hypothetical protein
VDAYCLAQLISKLYRGLAQVVYLPVDVERYRLESASRGFFESISRRGHYKRPSLIVETFTGIGRPLVAIVDRMRI